MNRKEIGILVALIVLVASLGGIVYGIKQISDVTITQEEVQQKLNASLPLTADNITINEAGISLQNSGINITLSAEGKKLGQPFSLTASSAIGITFDNQSGNFVFTPEAIKISNLKVRGQEIGKGVESLIDKASKSKRFGNWITKLDRYVPATELRDKIVTEKAEIGAKAEFKAEAMIEKSAKWLLQNVPLRPPDSLKSRAAQMMLESIEITDGKLIAHLSFWQFTKSVIAYALGAIICIVLIAFLCICPEAFMFL